MFDPVGIVRIWSFRWMRVSGVFARGCGLERSGVANLAQGTLLSGVSPWPLVGVGGDCPASPEPPS